MWNSLSHTALWTQPSPRVPERVSDAVTASVGPVGKSVFPLGVADAFLSSLLGKGEVRWAVSCLITAVCLQISFLF